jgi:hypothetical protein
MPLFKLNRLRSIVYMRQHLGVSRDPKKKLESAFEPVYVKVSTAAFMFGLSRTRLFKLLAEGKIKTRYVVQPGNNRGIRLVELASLRAYIESFPAEAPAA